MRVMLLTWHPFAQICRKLVITAILMLTRQKFLQTQWSFFKKNLILRNLDNSHLERMQELFKNGVVDVFEDDVLAELVTNSKLWDDLEA